LLSFAADRDALDEMHVLSVGVDLLPALDAQGFDGEEMVAAVAEACRHGGGDGVIPAQARPAFAPPRRCSTSRGSPRRSTRRERHLPAQRRLSAPAAGLRLALLRAPSARDMAARIRAERPAN